MRKMKKKVFFFDFIWPISDNNKFEAEWMKAYYIHIYVYCALIIEVNINNINTFIPV